MGALFPHPTHDHVGGGGSHRGGTAGTSARQTAHRGMRGTRCRAQHPKERDEGNGRGRDATVRSTRKSGKCQQSHTGEKGHRAEGGTTKSIGVPTHGSALPTPQLPRAATFCPCLIEGPNSLYGHFSTIGFSESCPGGKETLVHRHVVPEGVRDGQNWPPATDGHRRWRTSYLLDQRGAISPAVNLLPTRCTQLPWRRGQVERPPVPKPGVVVTSRIPMPEPPPAPRTSEGHAEVLAGAVAAI